jgi:hypothetical protein
MKRFVAIAFCMLAVNARADDEKTFGHWIVVHDQTTLAAITVNDSGNGFGEICIHDTKQCSWFVAIDIPCKTGDAGNLFGNAARGAAMLEAVCDGPTNNKNNTYRWTIKNWKTLEELIKRGNGRIGFVVARAGDQFSAYHFLLDGVGDATAQIGGPIGGSANTPPESRFNTTTQTL